MAGMTLRYALATSGVVLARLSWPSHITRRSSCFLVVPVAGSGPERYRAGPDGVLLHIAEHGGGDSRTAVPEVLGKGLSDLGKVKR